VPKKRFEMAYAIPIGQAQRVCDVVHDEKPRRLKEMDLAPDNLIQFMEK